jgi:hypothetical protein
VLRYLLWRLLGLLALAAGFALAAWLLHGGPGRVLRGHSGGLDLHALPGAFAEGLARGLGLGWRVSRALLGGRALPFAGLFGAGASALAAWRWRARRLRRYVRLRVEPYRGDQADIQALETMFAAMHKRLLVRWWRRLLAGQPSVSLEVHHSGAPETGAWLAVSCPHGHHGGVEAALRGAYPNCAVRAIAQALQAPPVLLRLKKHAEFVDRAKALADFERRPGAAVDRLLTVMAACGEPALVQLAAAPAPALFESYARHRYRRREARLARERRRALGLAGRSQLDDSELRGALELQHRPLFFADLRVLAATRRACEQIASELRAERAENGLVERGAPVRHGLLGLYTRRVQRGECNPLPPFRRGVYSAGELAALWQIPSPDYLGAPFARGGVPRAPASPAILRPPRGHGVLRDAFGPVSIHEQLRRQNVAVPGTVEQGKSSFLVASVAEDLERERCAVIVLDPKGDAADAALSMVPLARACTLLDLSHPTCGFNPLAVDAPADVIADYVVAALKGLFSDSDIRASSDRYLRNAIIAVLAYDRACTLWDAARLLSVGEEGYAYRSRVGARVRALPEFKEISQFFTAELSAQLADSRSTTTAKLDAPVNKLARLLNSPSIKRVLLNDSLRVDFDSVIAGAEVLVVKGALGAMGAGNTAVLMQLLIGMLDAALARQQDLVAPEDRVAVALKVDEAPLVINRGFAETMALKRSAGLETVACWQTDAQWVEREVREQLDALFAHRVYFATASVPDARAAARLTMAEYSDSVRPDMERLSSLGRPDVRLHLPKHHAIASWVTPAGRQPAFVAQTLPLQIDRERLARHAARQRERGARHRTDLRQPHWDEPRTDRLDSRNGAGGEGDASAGGVGASAGGVGAGVSRAGAARHDSAPPGARERLAAELTALPRALAESYRELLDLDAAHSVRRVTPARSVRSLEPEPLDLELLGLIATAQHVLTSQLHRRFNGARAVTTTQRRLKRLSDAGLVQRLQFHRRDGGGVPMCYSLTPEGHKLLGVERTSSAPAGRVEPSARAQDDLRQARQHVHVVGWCLALSALLGHERVRLRGEPEAAISPPSRTRAGERMALSPQDLRLPGGRSPHDFTREAPDGSRQEVERFETLRPDAIVEVGAGARHEPSLDLLIEREDRQGGGGRRKLERYDHFLAGWSAHVRRYGGREALALVVFLCRDRARARECARAADRELRACQAYAGEYPADWRYPARERVAFVAERDVHEGLLSAYLPPRLPPHVRVATAHGDPQAGEASATLAEIPGLARAAGAEGPVTILAGPSQ